MYRKLKKYFLKTFKCGRKLSCFPSGRALKCLSRPDGILCFSPQMSQEGGKSLCLFKSWSPSGTAKGLVLPASRRPSSGWTCHRWNWVRQGQLTPGQEGSCVVYKKSEAVTQSGAAAEILGCSIRADTSQNCNRYQHRSAGGGTGTTASVDQNHTYSQLLRWIVWFIGMGTRPNEAQDFALPIAWSWLASAKISSRTPWQISCLMAPREKPGFSASWKQSSTDGLGGRPKWLKQRANARKEISLHHWAHIQQIGLATGTLSVGWLPTKQLPVTQMHCGKRMNKQIISFSTCAISRILACSSQDDLYQRKQHLYWRNLSKNKLLSFMYT